MNIDNKSLTRVEEYLCKYKSHVMESSRQMYLLLVFFISTKRRETHGLWVFFFQNLKAYNSMRIRKIFFFLCVCVSHHRCLWYWYPGVKVSEKCPLLCLPFFFFNIDLMKTLTQCNTSIYTKEKALLLPGMEDRVGGAGALLQLISASRSNHLKITWWQPWDPMTFT